MNAMNGEEEPSDSLGSSSSESENELDEYQHKEIYKIYLVVLLRVIQS